MKNSSKDDISKKTSAYMKQKGVPNNLHSQMIFNVCDIIYKNKDSVEGAFQPLLSSVNILNNNYWKDALSIVLTYLKENKMDLTLSTMKVEDSQLKNFSINTKKDIKSLIQNRNTQSNFYELVQAFANNLPLKNSTELIQEIFPDIISSESLGQDMSNGISDDNS